MDARTWSAGEVGALVASALGVAIDRVVPVAGSVTNQDFAVDLVDGSRVLVKIGPADQLGGEAWVLPQVAALGLPVPQVRAFEVSVPALVLSWIDGRPSSDAAIMTELGRHLRTVHGSALPGYGSLVVDGPDVRGRFASWPDYIDNELTGLTDLVAGGLLTAGIADAVRARVDRLELRTYAGSGVLLHGDLKEQHVLAGDGRLQGVIDWGDPTVGDPLLEFARISMMGEPVLRAVLDGYGWAFTPGLARILAGYRLVWNVSALAYEYRAGGDWFDAYRDRLRADLDWLARSDTG